MRSAEFLVSLDKHSAAAANAALTSSLHDPRRDSSAASPPTGNHSETGDELGDLEHVSSQFARGGGGSGGRDSPKCHSRSSSHDSYFEQRKLSVQFKLDLDDEDGECEEEEGLSPRHVSSLDISEIAVNFDLEDNEMKIFSEDEAMVSTSVGSELSLPRSPLEETTTAMMSTKTVNSSAVTSTASSRPVTMRKATTTDSSPFVRGTTTTRQTGENPANKDDLSPTKTRRMSFKDKLRKFTSPTLPRKQNNSNNSVDVPSRLITDSGLGEMEGTGEGSSCSPLASLETRGDDSAKSLKVRRDCHKSIKNILLLVKK